MTPENIEKKHVLIIDRVKITLVVYLKNADIFDFW